MKFLINEKNNIKKIICSESEIAIGLSSGRVELWRIEKGNNNRDVGVKMGVIEAHSTRIKGMAICNGMLFTGDSAGTVMAFDKRRRFLQDGPTLVPQIWEYRNFWSGKIISTL